MSKEIKKQHYYDISSFEGNFDDNHEPPYSNESKKPVKDNYPNKPPTDQFAPYIPNKTIKNP